MTTNDDADDGRRRPAADDRVLALSPTTFVAIIVGLICAILAVLV